MTDEIESVVQSVAEIQYNHQVQQDYPSPVENGWQAMCTQVSPYNTSNSSWIPTGICCPDPHNSISKMRRLAQKIDLANACVKTEQLRMTLERTGLCRCL